MSKLNMFTVKKPIGPTYGDAEGDLIYGGIGDDTIGGGPGADGAMQFIAACADSAGARSLFDAQTRVVNDSSWRVAA
jgi:hypothetical protein